MKIGVFTDIHANLPALKKALAIFEDEACDQIIHVGDLIGIGPYPRECMELALANDKMKLIMGNHDYWYAFGLPDPAPPWMSKEEVSHQTWVHQEIGPNYKPLVQKWPFQYTLEEQGQKMCFQHYALSEEKNWFAPFLKHPNAEGLDRLFERVETGIDYIFYGHHHQASDIQGKRRYVNLGSAGCYDKPDVRIAIVELENSGISIRKITARYDDNGLMKEFDKRKIPARDFIRKTFIKREKP